MRRAHIRTLVASLGGLLLLVGVTGCLGGSGGNRSGSTPTTAVPGSARPAPTPPATKLAIGACQEYHTALTNPNTAVSYPEFFEADAEADAAEKLAPTTEWTDLAGALDTVKVEIQQIDNYQQQGTQTANSAAAATELSQALGLLRGDLIAVSTLCSADRI
jgi:hypothetical protein